MFDFSNYSTNTKYRKNWNKLVIGKMKHKTVGVATEQFAGLKRKTHSFLVDNNDHKKKKRVNKSVVATISHYEYKDVLLNKNCIRHSMNKIQSKNHRV